MIGNGHNEAGLTVNFVKELLNKILRCALMNFMVQVCN